MCRKWGLGRLFDSRLPTPDIRRYRLRRGTELAIELIDLRFELFVRGHQRVNEFVLLDRLDFFAEVEIGVGEQAGGDDIAGIDLQRRRQRLDRLGILVLLAKNAAEADPRGKVGRVDAEAGAKHLFRLRQLAVFAQLLGERKEQPALRISLDPELQLFDFGGYAGLSHVLEVRILLNNRGRRNLGRRNEPPPMKGRFVIWIQLRYIAMSRVSCRSLGAVVAGVDGDACTAPIGGAVVPLYLAVIVARLACIQASAAAAATT